MNTGTPCPTGPLRLLAALLSLLLLIAAGDGRGDPSSVSHSTTAALLAAGNAALAEQRYEDAQDILGRAVRRGEPDGGNDPQLDTDAAAAAAADAAATGSTAVWRQLLLAHASVGDYTGVLQWEGSLERRRIPCCEDGGAPTLYYIMGVALYNEGDLGRAAAYFARSLEVVPKDKEAWEALGDSLLHGKPHDPAKAAAAYGAALERNLTDDVSSLLMARAWVCDWRGRDEMEARLRLKGVDAMRAGGGGNGGGSGAGLLGMLGTPERGALGLMPRTFSDESLGLSGGDFLLLNRRRRVSRQWRGTVRGGQRRGARKEGGRASKEGGGNVNTAAGEAGEAGEAVGGPPPFELWGLTLRMTSDLFGGLHHPYPRPKGSDFFWDDASGKGCIDPRS